MLKKAISLLVCVAMILSLSTVCFAAGGAPNFNAVADKTEVNIGDTVMVTLSMNDAKLAAVGASVVFDKSVFECTKITVDSSSDNKLAEYAADGDAEISTVETANAYGSVGIGKARAERSYDAGNVLFIEFKAIAASAGAVFKLTEDSDGTDLYKDSEGRVVATVVVKGAAQEEPEINTDNNAAAEDANDAKTWAVAVDANYVAAGDKLIATLTNSNFTGEDATQVVELTVGDDVTGGADWAFNLKVRFKDVANRAATTLAIAKAN